MLLKFRELAPGTRPDAATLVLLNAMGLDSRDWPALPELDGRRVVALDRRGHGESAYEPTPGADVFADDVIETLDAEGIETFAVLGVSMGGCEAIDIATRHPERVTDLIVINTFVQVTAEERERRLTGLDSDFQTFTVAEYAVRLVEGMTFAALTDQTRATLIERFVGVSREAFRGLMEGLYTLDLTPRLGQITANVTVIGASEDRRTPIDSVRALAADLPGASFESITDAGHFPHIEQPTQFTDLVSAALARPTNDKE
ncbi:alpha/beta fold hydrolase [Microbacterium lushaniae]|uniref:Alpha/beta fold hydrolase n=1 Tax=Microbacterium lushaniae TaxID=2614639 RepID=A0A5J6L3U5_9MICO|nr:alpha/beta fold hydrolase [Microbacterium lushaniae]QEW03289.1 alpha/beta fold hydrolase [Microbacterium lushaniae]